MSPLLISSNVSVPPPLYLCALPPPICRPPPYTSPPCSATTATRISKENMRKTDRNPIRRLISTSIWSPITIQFRRHPTSPTPTPTPFFIANPGGGGRQHPRPGTSPDSHRRRSGLLTPLRRPLCHIVGVIIFIIALPQIGFGRRVRGGT